MKLLRSDKVKDSATQPQDDRNGHSIGDLKDQLKFIPVRNESLIIRILAGLSVGVFTLSLILLFLAFANRSLANRGRVYVQMDNGKTEVAQEFDVFYRDPKVIQTAVTNWIQMTYEWDNRIPGSEQTDPGIKIGSSNKTVPTKLYLAAFLLQDGFREEFLKQIADLIPASVNTGSRRSLVRFYSIGTPTAIADNKWKIDIVSTRFESSPSQSLREVPMNWTITVQAIPYVPPILGKEDPLVFRQKVYELLSSGLVITDIVPLENQP
jgi:hypothetical protein